jgi:HNH endonuclease
MATKEKKSKYKKKANIPKALREQVWLKNIGHCFEHKCLIDWCQNTMCVFDFHVGHNIPESHGGKTDIDNLMPICSRCNLSMGNQYSIEEWIKIGETRSRRATTTGTTTSSVSIADTAMPIPIRTRRRPWYSCACLPFWGKNSIDIDIV